MTFNGIVLALQQASDSADDTAVLTLGGDRIAGPELHFVAVNLRFAVRGVYGSPGWMCLPVRPPPALRCFAESRPRRRWEMLVKDRRSRAERGIVVEFLVPQMSVSAQRDRGSGTLGCRRSRRTPECIGIRRGLERFGERGILRRYFLDPCSCAACDRESRPLAVRTGSHGIAVLRAAGDECCGDRERSG